MRYRLVTAFAAFQFDHSQPAPAEICYLPEGDSAITPFVDGKPQSITVKVPAATGPAIAAKLQAALAERQKANVRPWFDFEHKGGASSALPQSFRYEPGKGVMCAVEWTGGGRQAIEGKDYSYFSPTFLIGDDGVPSGLPSRGPLGALVNEPAFREIPRIAASDAANLTEPPNVMSKLIFAALAISAAAENAETEAVNKITAMQGDVTDKQKRISELEGELADLKKANEKMKADCADADKKRRAGLVDAAVAAGKIAPKDEETKKEVLGFLEASEAMGTKYIGAMPQLSGTDISKPIINAGAAKPGDASGFEVKAKALVTAGDAKTIDEAFSIVAAADPASYADYLKTLS